MIEIMTIYDCVGEAAPCTSMNAGRSSRPCWTSAASFVSPTCARPPAPPRLRSAAISRGSPSWLRRARPWRTRSATRPRSQLSPDAALTLATALVRSQSGVNVAAKRAIARAAVELCEDGEAIIINGGTTTFEMGDFLCDRRLKVLTNSYPLAEILIHDFAFAGSRCPAARSIASRS